MCRWLAYVGDPIALEDVITRPTHSLIDQSLLARRLYLPGSEMASQFRNHGFPTNGDGFGIAWRGRKGELGQYRQIDPAWDSKNLRNITAHIESSCFLAHVRAAPGGTIAEQNCHPFVHNGWMFQHNGEINDFQQMKRDLTFDIDADLYPFIEGNGDTEVCFYLALSYGLVEDPVNALRRMVERVERARAEHGVTAPFRATMCASDGQRLIVMRWVSPDATDQVAPSLYFTTGPTLLHTCDEAEDTLPTGSHVVVSEPLELHWNKHTWQEVPAGTIGIVEKGVEPRFEPLIS